MVKDVYRQGYRDLPQNPERSRAALNDIILVKVQNLKKLTDEATCAGQPATCKKREIFLFLNGRQIKGLVPESGAPEFNEGGVGGPDGTLRYHLQRTPESREHWADLLGFDLVDWDLDRPVDVSVGLDDAVPVASDVGPGGTKKFHLVRFRGLWFLGWLALLALAVILISKYVKWRDLLRDTDAPAPVSPGSKPFSLGRCQAAWWVVLTLLSFIFIWLVTGQYDLSPSVVVLLGIGFGTSVGAFIIGKPPAGGPPPPTHSSSGSILSDIIDDGTGPSLHRVQMVIWTLVLGVLFIHGVVSRLAMPEFSETLLALMGISSSTYLAFKAGSK